MKRAIAYRLRRCPIATLHVNPTVPGKPVIARQENWLADEVRLHEPAVRGYLRRQFPSVEADDVVQESYLRLLKFQAGGKIASAKAYFFSVARNTARRFLRRRRQIFSESPVNSLPELRVLDGGPDAAELANARQRIELVAAAVDRLPARCRAILRCAIVDGLSTAEIAARLALSEATVRVQLARGVKKCADYLRARGEIE